MQSPAILHPSAADADERLEQGPLYEYLCRLPKKPQKHRDPEVAKLLDELCKWCNQEHGRQTEVAKVLGVDHRRLYDWFSGRIEPSLAVGLRIQAFLRAQKNQKRKTPSPNHERAVD